MTMTIALGWVVNKASIIKKEYHQRIFNLSMLEILSICMTSKKNKKINNISGKAKPAKQVNDG